METKLETVRIEQIIREAEKGVDYVIRGPEDGAKVATRLIGRDDREVLFVMCLNTKNNVIAVHRCHVGSLNTSLIHPREVFKSAILHNATSVIMHISTGERICFFFINPLVFWTATTCRRIRSISNTGIKVWKARGLSDR